MNPKTTSSFENSNEKEFLDEFSSAYGYNGKIDSIREDEYSELKAAYLDHSGSTVYPKSSVVSFTNDLTKNIYCNPHSRNIRAQHTSQRVEQVRARILKHFDANPREYKVIFTQNATAAIKLVGEIFPWTPGRSSYKYLRESHNSLIGLRRFAEETNSDIQAVIESDLEALFLHNKYPESFLNQEMNGGDDVTYNLFAYPAQCNFSGQRYPLTWTTRIKKLKTKKAKFLVLLDAAAYLTTSTLSLANGDVSPDFVAMSFYKIFGFPTGLGALLIKSELEPILRKRYFGGGTINAIAYDRQWQEFKENLSDRYEDGFVELEELASVNQIYISAGTHCNPGSVSRWINISGDDSISNYKAGKVCGDDKDIFDGRPTGSIRISLGAMSTIEDIITWLNFFKKYYVEETPSNYMPQSAHVQSLTKPIESRIFLEKLTLYPIKSCHGYIIPSSTSWTITNQGLLYDREWMLIDSETGRALSQKIFIKPHLFNTPTDSPLSYSNESPFLLVSQKSVEHVNQKIMGCDGHNKGTNNCVNYEEHSYKENEKGGEAERIVADCFRANFVVNGNISEYEEDQWKVIKIGGQVFK
ncbi:6403_t:CDS:2, partial [Acaulospora colombiana]